MSASTPDSDDMTHPDGRPFLWHERIAIHKLRNPDQGEYWIHTESTASALLLTIAAALKNMVQEMDPGEDRDQVRADAARYRHGVAKGTALEILRELTGRSPLTFFDMVIKVPPKAVCDRWPAGLAYIPPPEDQELRDSVAMANYELGDSNG